MFDRDRQQLTVDWLRRASPTNRADAAANIAALDAGHAFGETAELNGDLVGYSVEPAAGAGALPDDHRWPGARLGRSSSARISPA